MASAPNARPLSIFAGYMASAALLTAKCVATAVVPSSPAAARGSAKAGEKPLPETRLHGNRRRAVARLVFSLLAAVSLAVTWYHMFDFFRWSYTEWAAARSQAGELRLGDWLRDTTLFQQAWGSTMETAPRTFWSLQIFGFCALLSVMLPAQSKRRGIASVWAFMVVGQIVAISFASNLFFLAILARDTVEAPATTSNTKPRRTKSFMSIRSTKFWNVIILWATLQAALPIPSQIGQPWYLLRLLAPHVLAFAPMVISECVEEEAGETSEPMWLVKLAVLLVPLLQASMAVWRQGGNVSTVMTALYEHPAVSSVGWDVILCWVSYTAWFILGVH